LVHDKLVAFLWLLTFPCFILRMNTYLIWLKHWQAYNSNKLGVENLNKLVMIFKNIWSSNVRVDCRRKAIHWWFLNGRSKFHQWQWYCVSHIWLFQCWQIGVIWIWIQKHVNFEGLETTSSWVGMQSYQWQQMDVIKLFASNYCEWDHCIFFSNYTKLVMSLDAYKV
jgi:hypothetical protein